MIKAIHYVLDEKFIDGAIEQFSEVPGIANRYLLFLTHDKTKLQYIKFKNIEIYRQKTEIEKILCDGDYDVLFLHSLILTPKTILKIPQNIKIVWFSWGWDIYRDKYNFLSFSPIKLSLYKRKTRKTVNNQKKSIKEIIKFLYSISPIYFTRKLRYKKAIQRIDFCSTIIPTEFEILKKQKYFAAKYFCFSYALGRSFDLDLKKNFKEICSEGDILLGNSSDPSGNQADIIEILSGLDLRERKVIIPLSYGIDWYRQKIISIAKTLLKNNANPLLTFLPKEEYFEIIQKCSYVVMGHCRQQAMGNIYSALSKGCKLFLYEDSITYKYLKAEGFCIFSIEKDLNDKGLSKPLTKEQVLCNRNKLSEKYSTEQIRYLLLQSIVELKKEISRDKFMKN